MWEYDSMGHDDDDSVWNEEGMNTPEQQRRAVDKALERQAAQRNAHRQAEIDREFQGIMKLPLASCAGRMVSRSILSGAHEAALDWKTIAECLHTTTHIDR